MSDVGYILLIAFSAIALASLAVRNAVKLVGPDLHREIAIVCACSVAGSIIAASVSGGHLAWTVIGGIAGIAATGVGPLLMLLGTKAIGAVVSRIRGGRE